MIGISWRGEERVLWRLGQHRIAAQPGRSPVAAVMAPACHVDHPCQGFVADGARGPRAVLRAITCSAVAAAVQLPLKLACSARGSIR